MREQSIWKNMGWSWNNWIVVESVFIFCLTIISSASNKLIDNSVNSLRIAQITNE